jgi:hypothetical protein
MSVTILPRQPSLGDIIGQNLGQGFSSGIGSGLNAMLQEAIESRKATRENKELSDIFAPLYAKLNPPASDAPTSSMQPPSQQIAPQLAGMVPGHEQQPLIPTPMGMRPPLPGTFEQQQPSQAQGIQQQQAPAQPQLSQAEIIAKAANDPTIMMQLWRRFPKVAQGIKEIHEGNLKEQAIISKAKTAQEGREFELVKPYIQGVNEQVAQSPLKRSALKTSEQAFATGELGAFSKDYLADLFGIEALRSGTGAQALVAGKEFFLGNLSRVKAKGVNQWLEKQIKEMQPLIGRSMEANLISTAALEVDLDIGDKISETMNKIIDEKGITRKLPQEVSKELDKYATERQNELMKTVREIKKDPEKYAQKINSKYTDEESNQSIQKNEIMMRDPSGNLRAIPKDQVNQAKKVGYRLER